MRNIALLERVRLAALLALGLSVPDPLNQGGRIQMLNFVGSHYIEMFVGAEKPYISGWHTDSEYTPFLAARVTRLNRVN